MPGLCLNDKNGIPRVFPKMTWPGHPFDRYCIYERPGVADLVRSSVSDNKAFARIVKFGGVVIKRVRMGVLTGFVRFSLFSSFVKLVASFATSLFPTPSLSDLIRQSSR